MKLTIQSLLLTLILLLLGLEGTLWAEIRKFDKTKIEMLGVAIYEQDIRAAAATDMLFAKNIDAQKEGMRGWIIEGDAKKMLVRFVRGKIGFLRDSIIVYSVTKRKQVFKNQR